MMKHILLLLGESSSSAVASAHARRLARESGIGITALSGVDEIFIEAPMPGTIGGAAYRAQMEGGLKARAEKAQQQLTENFINDCTGDGIAPTTLSFHGDPVEAARAASAGCDLIVAGHDVTFRGLRSESTSDAVSHLLRTAPRPVLICPDHVPPEGDVLVAYDGSVPAMRALQLFVLIGSWSGRRVHVSSVDPDGDLAGRRAGMAASYLRLHGYEVDEHPIASTAPPAEVIEIQAAHSRIEVLVMGAYGHRGLKELLFGSTTQSIMGTPRSFVFLYH